jgi:hypothetical protein
VNDSGPRSIRGRSIRSAPRPQKTFAKADQLRVCPDCGTKLSKWNDGPLCNPCRADHGRARPIRFRGRTSTVD